MTILKTAESYSASKRRLKYLHKAALVVVDDFVLAGFRENEWAAKATALLEGKPTEQRAVPNNRLTKRPVQEGSGGGGCARRTASAYHASSATLGKSAPPIPRGLPLPSFAPASCLPCPTQKAAAERNGPNMCRFKTAPKPKYRLDFLPAFI